MGDGRETASGQGTRFLRFTTGLGAFVGAILVVAALLVFFGDTSARVDPATVPAGRTYWVTVAADGTVTASVACPSIPTWVADREPPDCQDAVLNQAGTVEALLLLALVCAFVVRLILAIRARSREVTTAHGFPVSSILSTAILVAVTGFGVIVGSWSVVRVSAWEPLVWLVVLVLAGITTELTARGMLPRPRPAEPIASPTSTGADPWRLHRLRARQAIVVRVPASTTATHLENQLRHAGFSDVADLQRDGGSWFSTETLVDGRVLVNVRLARPGGRIDRTTTFDGTLEHRPGGTELAGWLRSDPGFAVATTPWLLMLGFGMLSASDGDVGLALWFLLLAAFPVAMFVVWLGDRRTLADELARALGGQAVAVPAQVRAPRRRRTADVNAWRERTGRTIPYGSTWFVRAAPSFISVGLLTSGLTALITGS